MIVVFEKQKINLVIFLVSGHDRLIFVQLEEILKQK